MPGSRGKQRGFLLGVGAEVPPGAGSRLMGSAAHPLAGTEHPWIMAVQTRGGSFHTDTAK